MIGLTFVIIFIFLLFEYFNTNNRINFFDSINILSTLLPIFIISIFAFKIFTSYLDDSSNSEKNNNRNEDLEALRKEISTIKNTITNQKIAITSEEKEQLLNKPHIQFKNNITEDYLKSIENLFKQKELEEATQESCSRINREIDSLKRRGTINLFLGMFLSLFGLFFLGNIIFDPIDYKNLEQLLINIIPRTLLVIFIEIFSFFFLNLYKKSLDEVKYFQNEMTNLEAKYLSLYIAKQSGNFKLLSHALENLLQTERNFVLKKDETTIELEKNKIEAQSSNNTVQALKDIINFKR